ncbi:hypothetical protein [Streptomyces sp. SD31]|uniref:hypothetical protein n=1 Tax=Streptomyces sp. SD31 TaxID=3452208 RepID=UPI003F8B296A
MHAYEFLIAVGRSRPLRSAQCGDADEDHGRQSGEGERGKPQSPLFAASNCPPSHGPKTAPKRPMPEVQPTAVARFSGRERIETVA